MQYYVSSDSIATWDTLTHNSGADAAAARRQTAAESKKFKLSIFLRSEVTFIFKVTIFSSYQDFF